GLTKAVAAPMRHRPIGLPEARSHIHLLCGNPSFGWPGLSLRSPAGLLAGASKTQPQPPPPRDFNRAMSTKTLIALIGYIFDDNSSETRLREPGAQCTLGWMPRAEARPACDSHSPLTEAA